MRLFAKSMSFSADFQQKKALSPIDNANGSDNIRRKATNQRFVAAHRRGVSGDCCKWSGAMLGFWHTTLLVGPQRRSQLDSSQCLDCCWSVAGSKTAIAIAEEAHVCINRVQRKPAARVPSPSVINIA